uniref:Pleckstrin homology and RhoGEF domain containing G3 n=1 Tax=Latimeria chalumnae TaxID=7897 RepID=H2ZRU3_LATCH
SESSTSVSADSSDADRPVSIASTASSGSSRDSSGIYDEESAVKLRRTHNNNNNLANGGSGQNSRASLLSPFAAKSMAPNPKLSYVDRVVMEILETERMYVRDLRSIVEDYLGHIIDTPDLPIRPELVSALFGNIEDIYAFNSELFQDLERCNNDPVAIAQCFVDKSQDFDIYTQYCTNYPNSVAALTECMRSKTLAKFFRERQATLKRTLPLGSYLLKPVQRILKYHLLLQIILSDFFFFFFFFSVVSIQTKPLGCIFHCLPLQEVQSLLINWKGPDLTTYGELVLEGTFRVHRARNERTLFLFDKMLLITKKRGDHYVYKTHISCSTLMLIESTRSSLCFTVTYYKNTKQQHNIQAKSVEEKRLWTHHIKRLILENHHAIIPQKAKEAILEMDPYYTNRYKYSPERLKKSISCQPFDDVPPGGRQGRRQSGQCSDTSQPFFPYLSFHQCVISHLSLGLFGSQVLEPTKQILKHLDEKSNLTGMLVQHAGSDGALLEVRDSLLPGTSVSTLGSSQGESEAEGPSLEEEELGLSKDSLDQLNPGDGKEREGQVELTECEREEVEEEEEILMGDDQTDEAEDEGPKGCKRQNSQTAGNAEKRKSVETSAPAADMVVTELKHSPNEAAESEGESCLKEEPPDSKPMDFPEQSLETEANPATAELDASESVGSVDSSMEGASAEIMEEAKTLSSEESCDEEEGDEDEVAPEHKSESILPPSVLNQASVIAERFVSNLSRRSSVAFEDGRSIGCPTPRLVSRSSSVLSLEGSERAQCSGSISEMQGSISSNEALPIPAASGQPHRSALSSPATPNPVNPAEMIDTDRALSRRKDSTLSKQDRLLLNKIKSYYDHAEHQDASFSIKRRESLTYIPVGLVKNSVSKINSIPKQDAAPEIPVRRRIDSSSSTLSNKSSSRPTSLMLLDVPAPSSVVGLETPQGPITDAEFKSPSEMVQVWQEMEKAVGAAAATENSRRNRLENQEPLVILEESDLSTITEESSASSPEKVPPGKLTPEDMTGRGAPEQSAGVREASRKVPPKVIDLSRPVNKDELLQDMPDKSKVFQLARKYSQRIKNSKPVVRR